MSISARDIAYEVLGRVRRDEAYANLTLSALLDKHPRMGGADRGLATELVYGVLRHRRQLDHVLALHSSRPLARVDADMLDILRVAAYQVLMLDRIPDHAAVNEAVSAVRRGRGKGVAGFANAVLRKLTAADLERRLPENPAKRLAVQCSLPIWLARRWIQQLGRDQAELLARSLLERAPLTARVNTLRTDMQRVSRIIQQEGGQARAAGQAPAAFFVSGLARPFVAASYLEGLWTAQDEGAQLASELLAPQPGETVLDACCGVGGKATHLAALMQDRGRVICADHSPRKLELLREHCLRLGISSCETRRGDLLERSTLHGLQVDRVLLDAPCSGLGVIRRHPEQKWRIGQGSIERLASLQRRLLGAAVAALKPAGVLLYSVCTTTEEEGPSQVTWLRETHQMELLPPPPGPLVELANQGSLRLWPHLHGTDGFFLARLQKREEQA